MSDPKSLLAEEIHAAADHMSAREIAPETLTEAHLLVARANELLSTGKLWTEEERLIRFASQMVVPLGAPIIADGAAFEAFTESPYSGKHNPMRPTSAAYRRVGDEVHADVLVGPALEGAPGRAHGGLTAAVFDDIMGATQRITGLSGYTRTLTVTYRAKLPIDEVVHFIAELVDRDDRTFTIDAKALHEGTTVATARAVFTSVRFDTFEPPEDKTR